MGPSTVQLLLPHSLWPQLPPVPSLHYFLLHAGAPHPQLTLWRVLLFPLHNFLSSTGAQHPQLICSEDSLRNSLLGVSVHLMKQGIICTLPKMFFMLQM